MTWAKVLRCCESYSAYVTFSFQSHTEHPTLFFKDKVLFVLCQLIFRIVFLDRYLDFGVNVSVGYYPKVLDSQRSWWVFLSA
jgi:hypothetical protein